MNGDIGASDAMDADGLIGGVFRAFGEGAADDSEAVDWAPGVDIRSSVAAR